MRYLKLNFGGFTTPFLIISNKKIQLTVFSILTTFDCNMKTMHYRKVFAKVASDYVL